MSELDELRKSINEVDDKIVKLYVERMQIAKKIGDYKRQNNVNVLDNSREKEVLFRLAEQVPDEFKLYLKQVYEVMFSTSRAYQAKSVATSSVTVDKINKILMEELKDFPVSSTVACQGVEGANSGQAAENLFPISKISYFKTFDAVFNAVQKGFCKYGVLPIENSTAGSVSEVYDLMKKHNFHIVKSIKLRIDHCLVTLKGVDIKNVKKVVSHKQAIMQCSEYLRKLGVETEYAENTAVAAQRLVESGDKTTAVICSKRCAELYSLCVHEEKIQDGFNNFTRFICISKDLEVFKGAKKISIMSSLAHEPGSLNKVLSKFYSLGLNLVKLESRPILDSDFEFMFYFDFEGDVCDMAVRNLLAELENGSDKFVLLGVYQEV